MFVGNPITCNFQKKDRNEKIEQYGQLKDEEWEENNGGADMFHFDLDEDVFCVYSQYIDDISLFSRMLREACNDEQRMQDYLDLAFLFSCPLTAYVFSKKEY